MKLEHNYFKLTQTSGLFEGLPVGTCFEVFHDEGNLPKINEITPTLFQLVLTTEIVNQKTKTTKALLQLGLIDTQISDSDPMELERCTQEEYLNYLDSIRKKATFEDAN